MVVIHVFHGFLGSPRDFQFLNGPGISLHDVYKEVPQTAKGDILIGYSMGGRLAMDLGKKNGFRKLILINAHPGIVDDKEREVRSLWEEEVLERLKIPATFLSWWNELPLFKYDKPLRNIPARSSELFEKMRLSRQEDYLPFLQANADKVHWILGADDPKYSTLTDSLKGFDVQLIAGGHRLFQNPQLLEPAIRKLL